MLADETVAFLESGCAVTIATVSEDGWPHASRGWAADVLSADQGLVEVLVDVEDVGTVANAVATGRAAITIVDVPTLHSMQLKGRVTGTRTGAETERQRARRFCDDFYGDINATDGTPLELLERMTPADFVAIQIQIDEWYDQTPGPSAGTPVQP